MVKKKILDRYIDLPLPLKATIWFTICQFMQKGIGVLTMPFVARLLSTSEYGRASTFASWESLFMMIVTLSSFQAINYICTKHDKQEATLSSLLGYNIVISLFWGMLLFLNTDFITRITGMSATLILCMYLYCTFTSFITC